MTTDTVQDRVTTGAISRDDLCLAARQPLTALLLNAATALHDLHVDHDLHPVLTDILSDTRRLCELIRRFDDTTRV